MNYKQFGRILVVAAMAVGALPAQKWELGVLGGGAMTLDRPVQRGNASADAGLKTSYTFGFIAGRDSTNHVGGEVRYLYRDGDLKLTSGSDKATFAGHVHTLHYDLIVHTKGRESRIRPYFAIGGGVRFYRGTGRETAFQPLSRFVLLSRTSELKPVISAGGGVRISIRDWADLRFDVRDYITPFPKKVIAPHPQATLTGWLHDITPSVAFSVRF
jgi:hypothetical protein